MGTDGAEVERRTILCPWLRNSTGCDMKRRELRGGARFSR